MPSASGGSEAAGVEASGGAKAASEGFGGFWRSGGHRKDQEGRAREQIAVHVETLNVELDGRTGWSK
jgi:hypothetical protein